ncbi:hypothetical protein IP76_06520 [Rhizobium sp. AAP43]|nr:hypothetical protein IP76_06520 [Rhizobium sp. AAP43]
MGFRKSSSRMSPGCGLGSRSVMVVDDPDIAWSSIMPVEANAPLVVDPYAVLAEPVTFQGFQPIAWRNAEVLQDPRVVDQTEFSQRNSLNVRRKLAASLTGPDALCFFIRKALDHDQP